MLNNPLLLRSKNNGLTHIDFVRLRLARFLILPPKNIMKIALQFLGYSEKIARAYSAIAQNSTLWKSTFRLKNVVFFIRVWPTNREN